ncbi:MAG: PIN domain-containing protein [Betaproteobacteria bacterium]|nr:PIN domain-containing protein [Betaproteobacteria bacterium]
MTGVIVDTGFLVPLFRPADRLREPAREFLRHNRQPLYTAAPVIVEACFFLTPEGKARLFEWIVRGALAVSEVPTSAYGEIRTLIRKYADRDIDFADAALVWLAGKSGCREILTVDAGDFGVFRLEKGRRFKLIDWFER